MYHEPMTLEEFEKNLDVHGASMDRWPTVDAGRGRELFGASARARAVHARAEELARELDLALPAASLTTGALRARILAAVERDAHRSWAYRFIGGAGWLRPAVMALIPLGLGFAIGVGYSESSGVNDDLVSDVSLFSFAAYEDYPDAQ